MIGDDLTWSLILTAAAFAGQGDPGRIEEHLGRAYKHQQDGRYERAAEEFQAALRLDPGQLRPRYQLGVCYFALGRREQARTEFELVLRKSGDAGADYYLGRLDLLEGNYESARRRLEGILKSPPFPDTAFYLALAYYELGDVNSAIRFLEEAARQAPRDFRVRYRLARVYQEAGRREDAQREYSNFTRQRKDYQDGARHALECGEALRSKPIEEARQVCLRLYDPNDPDKLTLLGIMFGENRAYEDALAPLELAATLDPGSFEIWHNLGLSYFRLRRNREARDALEKAVRLRPDFFAANALLGATLYLLKEDDKAFRVLTHANRLDPADQDTAALLARVSVALAEKAMTARDYRQAVGYLARAAELLPEDVDVRKRLQEASRLLAR